MRSRAKLAIDEEAASQKSAVQQHRRSSAAISSSSLVKDYVRKQVNVNRRRRKIDNVKRKKSSIRNCGCLWERMICFGLLFFIFIIMIQYKKLDSMISSGGDDDEHMPLVIDQEKDAEKKLDIEVKPNDKFPVKPLLPNRIISVFGLESSGTKFITQIIAEALGVFVTQNMAHKSRILLHRDDDFIELHHYSLPNGGSNCSLYNKTVISFIPPEECTVGHDIDELQNSSKDDLLERCREIGINSFVQMPLRTFVNISSHIQWYNKQGVISTAIIVIRDHNIVDKSAAINHCKDEVLRKEEMELGYDIIKDSIVKLSSSVSRKDVPNLIVVSYESVVSLGATYLQFMLSKLELPYLDKISRIHRIKDGNKRYLKENV